MGEIGQEKKRQEKPSFNKNRKILGNMGHFVPRSGKTSYTLYLVPPALRLQ
jgi:hypothetical protein